LRISIENYPANKGKIIWQRKAEAVEWLPLKQGLQKGMVEKGRLKTGRPVGRSWALKRPQEILPAKAAPGEKNKPNSK
jgi:hypothetical protein